MAPVQADAGRGRIAFLDLLRVISCFGVIVTHTVNTPAYTMGPSVSWTLALAAFYFTKTAVPVFVMITGYLLLPRQQPPRAGLVRAGRVALVLWAVSLLYIACGVCPDGADRSLGAALGAVWQGPVSVALWYVYMYLGLLLLMPIWQRLAKAMTKQEYWLLLGVVYTVFSLWPMLARYLPALRLPVYFEYGLPGAYLGWLFTGGYFALYPPRQSRARSAAAVLLLAAALAVCIAGAYGWYDVYVNSYYLFGEEPEFLPIVVQAVCLFYLCSRLALTGRAARAVCAAGRYTFGIYLFADLITAELAGLRGLLAAQLHPLAAVAVLDVCVFAIGLAVTWGLCRIPVLKKLLGA